MTKPDTAQIERFVNQEVIGYNDDATETFRRDTILLKDGSEVIWYATKRRDGQTTFELTRPYIAQPQDAPPANATGGETREE